MKKALNIALRVITILILIFAVFVMIFTIISVNTVGKDDASFFGYKPYIVLSDSMQDTFEVGDIAVSKEADANTLKVGDIVSFHSIDPANYGEVVTHKIREITTYEGESAFITYGTATGVDDTYPVPFENVIGKYQFRLPKMGYFFQFLRTSAGYVTIILIPFLILIVLQAIRFIRLFKQYKKEQQMEIETQKAEVEAERLKTQKMQEELEQLRAKLASNPLTEKQDGDDNNTVDSSKVNPVDNDFRGE